MRLYLPEQPASAQLFLPENVTYGDVIEPEPLSIHRIDEYMFGFASPSPTLEPLTFDIAPGLHFTIDAGFSGSLFFSGFVV